MNSIATFFTCVSFGVILFFSLPCRAEIQKAEDPPQAALQESAFPEAEPVLQVQTGKLGIVGVHFASGTTSIDEKYMGQLQQIAEALNSEKLRTAKILIKGHSDSTGSTALNLQLSKLRAQKAMALLVDKFGIAESRLACDGAGETTPIAANDTNSGRFLNRRIEFIYRGEVDSENQ